MYSKDKGGDVGVSSWEYGNSSAMDFSYFAQSLFSLSRDLQCRFTGNERNGMWKKGRRLPNHTHTPQVLSKDGGNHRREKKESREEKSRPKKKFQFPLPRPHPAPSTENVLNFFFFLCISSRDVLRVCDNHSEL